MARTAWPTVLSGDGWTASQHNTYGRDNDLAYWIFTTAGDMAYATSSSVLARLAIGVGGTYLTSSGTAPQWSNFYRYHTVLLNTNVALQVGDDAFRFRVSGEINGWNLASVAMSRKSGTGVLTVQIRNVSAAVDMLSTKLTIDTGETDTTTAAVPAVINTANDGVSTGQQIAIDVDDPGTNTLFAYVEMSFLKP